MKGTCLTIGVLLVSSTVCAQTVRIVHLNVGQGDATLILGPADASGNRVSVLMDTGDISGPDGGTLVRSRLAAEGLTSLDFVIVTHYTVSMARRFAADG